MFDECAYCIYSKEIGYDYDVYVCTLKSCIYGEKKEQTSKSNKMIDEENIFENAYFGKPYKTRDGRKALYLRESDLLNSCQELITEDMIKIIVWPNGRARMDNTEIPNDIVGEWKEEEPSDEIIMLILNCIGYEEESWIEFVRKELKKRKYDTGRNNQEVAK